MWRADCSRVTHPFAARVPRRAFPLDLHVLSTPPAFVLSQDQTLQQKPVEKQSPSNKKVAKGIQNPKGSGKKLLGTGLSSTLLSSQRTTTHRKTNHLSRRPAPGALVQLYPRYFVSSNPGSHPNPPPQNDCEGTTKQRTTSVMLISRVSVRTAAAGPRRAPLARPSPWRLGNSTRFSA